MPLKDIDDFRNRLRSSQSGPSLPQPRYAGDIQPATPPRPMAPMTPRPISRPQPPQSPLQRGFPAVGATLATYSSTPAQTMPLPRGTYQEPDDGFDDDQSVPLPRHTAVTQPKRRRKWVTKKRIALAFLLVVLGIGGWMGGKLLVNVNRIFNGNIFSVLTTARLKGEDTGRVNFLLAGNSADDQGHDGAELTDSIMVVSINTKDNTAYMMSVPRDLWVDIPGYGHAKINEAYVDGEDGHFSQSGYPNGGMGLLENVIQQNFGIPIDYYALVDYSALRDSVDAVGGIDINIQSSDPRGLYDPSIDYATHGPLVKLTNGMHHLNGEQALDLARARGDSYGSYGFPQSDFDRTNHQRQIIIAIKNKALTAGVLANPISLSNLFDSIGKNVKTDMTLSEARRLYDISKGIDNANIQSVSLNNANGTNLLASYQTPQNTSALIPAAGIDDFSAIKEFVKSLTSNNPLTRESATVVVLNGTTTTGLAAKMQSTLEGKDINVTAIGDAASPSATSTIIDASGGNKPATLALLTSMFGKNVVTDNPYAKTYGDADFIVILGSDQVQAAAPAQ